MGNGLTPRFGKDEPNMTTALKHPRLSAIDTNADGIAETGLRFDRGDISAVEITERCLGRIAEYEPILNAWTYFDAEYARAQGRALDHQTRRGALHAIPVGIKDIFDTADMPTAYGSNIYKGYRPAEDSVVVKRLRAAGAILPGKTVTTEFAHSFPGATVNPHNPAHTPGGSSSGSAAAVAAGFVFAAVGTQTSGSVIRPASFCGVVGFKPTYGRIPTMGVKALAPSLDTVGVFARSVEDAGLVAAILWNSENTAPTALPGHKPSRIGVCKTQYWAERGPGVENALDLAIAALRDANVRVDAIDLPQACHGLNAFQETIYAYEANVEFSGHASRHPDKISSDLRELLTHGSQIPQERYQEALEKSMAARAAYEEMMLEFDFLLTPSAPGEAPRGLSKTGDPLFNRLWTLLRVPCLSLPTSKGPQGLPIGVQLVGSAMKDEGLLSFGEWFSQHISLFPSADHERRHDV
jgi:Asp-tRNA(Asn)/Glu-tRNA(Gln) amidotransferase A subunit family amidase